MVTIHVSKVQDSLKCHRIVTKQTNPLQVDNLITNKSYALCKASKRIVKTQYVKTYALANVKNFLQTSRCWVNKFIIQEEK
jgi:hypothetical protein